LNGTPKSPLTGGGILGAGFGVNIAPNGKVWMGNFGWGGSQYNPSPVGIGSLTEFSKNGQPLSGSNGIQAGTDRVQGIATDSEGNIWLCSFNNDRIVVIPKGNPSQAIYYQQVPHSGPFDIQIASDGTAWVTNSFGLIGPNPGSRVARYAFEQGQIRQIFSKPLGHSLKGLALDSQGQAWVASGEDGCVYLVDSQGNEVQSCTGGGINAPWSTSVDGDDNVWVADFGPEAPGDFLHGRITKLAGSNPATRPPGLSTGDPISPDSGYTLPSAGQEVLLHDGTPLYGNGNPPSFDPLMRITAVAIDQAGNVWAANNWKPPFVNDLKNNPGGDGICIFVGLAKPLPNRWAK
jgi:DNA-binding beta-propeller fold protein YncE